LTLKLNLAQSCVGNGCFLLQSSAQQKAFSYQLYSPLIAPIKKIAIAKEPPIMNGLPPLEKIAKKKRSYQCSLQSKL
jgi:hypothetical protein